MFGAGHCRQHTYLTIPPMIKNFLQNAGIIEKSATEDEAPVTSTKPKTASNAFARTQAAISVPAFSHPTGAPLPGAFGVQPDPTMVEDLSNAAAASKVVGYGEFKTLYDTFAAIPEPQRTSMALAAVAAANKVTPDMVLASINDRLSLVEVEATHFAEAMAATEANEVTARQTEADSIAQAIERMKAEIQEKEVARANLLAEANQAQMHINTTRIQFDASANAVRAALNSEREKIAAFIPTVTK